MFKFSWGTSVQVGNAYTLGWPPCIGFRCVTYGYSVVAWEAVFEKVFGSTCL